MTDRRIRLAIVLVACLAAAAIRCASAPGPVARDDRFPLDPREDLTGPFDEAVEEGWRALLAGDPGRARTAFARASGGASRRAAAIGEVEALVVSGRSEEAAGQCGELLASADSTLPLLVACGEAQARLAEPLAAYELYRRAAERAPTRAGLRTRADRLRDTAADSLLASAQRAASAGLREEAHARAAHALALSPGESDVLARAAEVECAIGEKQRALEYFRDGISLGGLDAATRERAGDVALEVGEDALAVTIFERLASEDPRYEERAREARLAFRIANWPEPERQAAHAHRLTRGAAASLTWWMCPEVREAKVRAGIVATDVLERRDSRAVMRAISLGLLDVDPHAHRARPDAPLARGSAAQWLLRMAVVIAPPGAESPACFQGLSGWDKRGAEATSAAERCGLLPASGGSAVSGTEFTRGLDRLRALPPAGGRP